jgi:hypothetical protein
MYDLNFNLIYGLITYVIYAFQLIPTISSRMPRTLSLVGDIDSVLGHR